MGAINGDEMTIAWISMTMMCIECGFCYTLLNERV